MRNYDYREKWHKLLTPEIVKKLTIISEYKGEQRLFIEAHQDELNELVEIAKSKAQGHQIELRAYLQRMIG